MRELRASTIASLNGFHEHEGSFEFALPFEGRELNPLVSPTPAQPVL
jgi:hypothetical protein